MSESERPVLLIPYVLIWILVTWAMIIASKKQGQVKDGDHFIAAFMGFFWPLGVALLVIASPFLLVAWIVSKLPGGGTNA